MNEFSKLNIAYTVFAVAFLAVAWAIMPESGSEYDLECWDTWSKYILDHGLAHVYDSGSNYLPLYHYILGIYAKLTGSHEYITANLHLLKLITLFFHCISGYILIRLLMTRGKNWQPAFALALFFLLNAAILYNSMVWGQVDGILTCLVFTAFYFAYTNRPVWAMTFLVLALNFKLQAIVFLPLIILMILPDLIEMLRDRRMWHRLAIPVICQVFIVLPFWINGNLVDIWSVVKGSFGKYPYISLNAYNMWELLIQGDLQRMTDARPWLGLSLNKWGLILFLIFGFLALVPLMLHTLKRIRERRRTGMDLEDLAAAAALCCLVFFYVNTQMHERYSHPALIFLVLLAILRRSPWLALTGCLAYLLNLEAVLRAVRIDNYDTFIFLPEFVSGLYLLTILGLYLLLYMVPERKK
jgi:Gpi18-like mannosyltransferase